MRLSTETPAPPNELQSEAPVCGALMRADGSGCWRVWSSYARSMSLALYPEPGECRVIEMRPEPGGYFVHSEPDVEEGQRYAFRIDHGPERPDPMSRWQPEGVHRPSALFSPDRFQWSEGDWAGLSRKELVIYELHVGTFTPEGTFDAMIGRLEELRQFGVTALELMPVAQFPGTRGWGYEGVYPFAVQESYGGPRDLQQLVNACHRIGLAVILDVVYNHLGPEGNYFAEFGDYFTDRYRTPWGRAINFDSRGCDAVRAFVLDNVRYWIHDFHIDGLRVDAVHAVFDSSPRHILREIKEAADEEARKLGRSVHIIAESDLNDVRLLDPPESGGYGLDAQWSDDFHHSLHALLTGERFSYYADFGRPEHLVKAINRAFVYNGTYSAFRGRRHGGPIGAHSSDHFVISVQNHDQIGNRPAGERLSALLEPNQLRLAAGVLLLSPQIPLIFMGEEYGETRPFPYFCSFEQQEIIDATRRGRREEFVALGEEDKVPDPLAQTTFESAKLSWAWPEGSRYAGMRRLYYDLLAIRRFWLAFDESTVLASGLIEDWHDALPVLRLVRKMAMDGPSSELTAYFNLSRQKQPVPQDALPESGQGNTKLLLSSEESRFGGSRGSQDPIDVLLPFELRVFGPASWSQR
jgi:maltooligosyltrehalose trehalohydrolase